jgi:hypothetical protein
MKTMRFQVAVEFVTHHSGFHPNPALGDIQFQQAMAMAGHIDHHAASDRLADQTRPAAARKNGKLVAGAKADGGKDVGAIPRLNDRKRHDLVHARIRGISAQGVRIRPDTAPEDIMKLRDGYFRVLCRAWSWECHGMLMCL